MAPETMGSIPGRVIPKTGKIPPYLTPNIIRYGSKVKWSNPDNGVTHSVTPQCSSYWKGSIPVTLDYSNQLYFYIYQILFRCLLIVPKKSSFKFFVIWFGNFFQKHNGCLRGVMVKEMGCGIVVNEFELQSRYYVHFRIYTLGKWMNPLSSQLWIK